MATITLPTEKVLMEAETKLTHTDDRIRLSDWLPPQWGLIPHIRLGKRWINICWLLPLGFLFLLIGVAVAQELRQIPAMQAFLTRYPGQEAAL